MSKNAQNNPKMNTNQLPFEPGFLNYLSDGVVVLDHSGQIVTINTALTQMLGWTDQELAGQFCYSLLDCQPFPVKMARCQNLCPYQGLWEENSSVSTRLSNPLPNILSKSGQPSELTLCSKDGRQYDFSVSFSPLHLRGLTSVDAAAAERGDFDYSLIILRDISQQKRLERIKTQFLVTASHQLRTPLASIKNSIGLLLDNVPPQILAEPLMRLLRNIQNSSLRMERLVNDLIELANLQSGLVGLRHDLLEVAPILEAAILDKKLLLEQKRQLLQVELPATPLMIRGDGPRLIQVLGHLLSNASKFSPADTPIVLKVAVKTESETASPQVIFSLADQGRGISLTEQQLIFDKFYQSEVSENADGSGVGLGLPLAKAWIELHGGKLWVDSTPGKGSTFYFELPLVQVQL